MDDTLTILFLEPMRMVIKLSRKSPRTVEKSGHQNVTGRNQEVSGVVHCARPRIMCQHASITRNSFGLTRQSPPVLKSETSRDVAKQMVAPVFGTNLSKHVGRRDFRCALPRIHDSRMFLAKPLACIKKKVNTVTCENDPRARS